MKPVHFLFVAIAFCAIAYVGFQFAAYHNFGQGFVGAETEQNRYDLWSGPIEPAGTTAKIQRISYRFEAPNTAVLMIEADNTGDTPILLGFEAATRSDGFLSGMSNMGHIQEIPPNAPYIIEFRVPLAGPIHQNSWIINAGIVPKKDTPTGDTVFLPSSTQIIATWTCDFDQRQSTNVHIDTFEETSSETANTPPHRRPE